MIQIVIDISKDVYYRCKNERVGLLPFDVPEVCYAIQNGKVLPKHGDLKDYDTLDDTVVRLNSEGWQITRNEYKLIDRVVFEMPTLIETKDKENKDGKNSN